MPIYEYECEECGTRHEKLVMAQGQKIVCPRCASGKQTIQISVFSASAKSGGNGATESNSAGDSCGCTRRTCGCN